MPDRGDDARRCRRRGGGERGDGDVHGRVASLVVDLDALRFLDQDLVDHVYVVGSLLEKDRQWTFPHRAVPGS